MTTYSSPHPGKAARRPAFRQLTEPRRILGGLMALLAAVTLPSCQTTAPPTSARTSGQWHMVRMDPPTYFPREIPADHPTGVHDGYWVSSGDARGTRFFIPSNGVGSPEALIAEAQAAMTPEAREALDRKRRESDVDAVVGGTIEVAGKITIAILQAMASAGI